MNLYRSNQIYISNECRFYLGLRCKQVVAGTEAARTLDEQANCDLVNLYTTDNPEWVEAWGKREEARQKHKKELEQIEADVLPVSSQTTEPTE